MDIISLVTNSLEYYDQNDENHKYILKTAQYVKFIKAETDMEHNVVVFFNEDKKEFFRSRYEIIGLYDSDSNVWAWSWTIPRFQKNNTNIARKILNYGVLLDPNIGALKTELITSRFRISHHIQLDIHVAIAAYISKNKLIYKHYNYISKTPDVDGYLHIGETLEEAHTIYYMFLLDKFDK